MVKKFLDFIFKLKLPSSFFGNGIPYFRRPGEIPGRLAGRR
jgi:hypothetical protein